MALLSVFQVAALAAPPLVDIPNGPMTPAPVHPNIVMDLSVEFPTAGAAYRTGEYLPTVRYVGYFDSSQCYTYTRPSTYSGGKYDGAADDQKYFKPAFAADTSFKCGGAGFSGNFMNWAASSALDLLRLSLTGGDRIIDLPGTTILQRVMLPEAPVDFYASDARMPLKMLNGGGPVRPADVTPFASRDLYIVSCKNRILFASNMPALNLPPAATAGRCDAQGNPDKNLGEYLVRVETCSDTQGPLRPGYCTRYGSHYKPEGELQKNADRMRFAVFGYLLDSDYFRYGGVLRAPAKYVGPNVYDLAMRKSRNPETEWDPATGVFLPDPSPDPSLPGSSGVINYLNKFGRTGNYKLRDPISELYYESLRYLQGMQPTPEAAMNVTLPMKDNFPVISKWVDPITTSCQKNSIIMIADSHTDYDYYVPGNTRSVTISDGSPLDGTIADGPRPAIPDTATTVGLHVMDWTKKIGDIESVGHGVDTRARPRLAGLENQKTGWQAPGDGEFKGTYYIAGLSYFANVSELRKDKKGIHAKTYVVDVDESGSGTLEDSNSRIDHPRDSQLYLMAKYGRFEPDADGFRHENPYWPIPTAATPKSSRGCYSYLWDLAGNCDPENYFLGSDGSALVRGVHQIFNEINTQGEALNLVTASSTTITESEQQFIYQGKFQSNGWGGDLRRYPVTYAPGTGLVIGTPDAQSPTLTLREPDWPQPAPGPAIAKRKIFTYAGAALPMASTIPFEWESFDANQKRWLNGIDNLGETRLHYLRGSTSGENVVANGTAFRTRAKAANGLPNLLGDIVHSNPVFKGAPAVEVQGSGYDTFTARYGRRAPAVYVGANDGMLHAFSADLSREYFAYVPKIVFPALAQLTRPDYDHRAYVDGGTTVAEARVGGAWKTVLAASLGGGGQGLFALDVTDPENFDPANGALWEFSDADDADMGNNFSAPVIAKFAVRVANGLPVYEYFVVTASGLNNYAADGAPGSSPAGALFLLSLDKKPNVAWTRGVNYFKFPIPTAAVNLALQSGLSAPTVTVGPDGAARLVYAGDLQGNLWRFDFKPTLPLTSVAAHRLFQASDGANRTQPITAPPQIVFAPEGGYMVLFGTGKYLENSDADNKSANAYYGIFDSLDPAYTVAGRNQLQQRQLTVRSDASQLTISGAPVAYAGRNPKRGWYFDFASSSERLVTPGLLDYGRVFFNTQIPPDGPCTPSSSGRSYAINTLTGLADGGAEASTGFLATAGILSSPVAFDTLNKSPGARATPNAIGRKTVQRTYSIASVGSKGVAAPVNKVAALSAGRLSWNEIFNYHELHNNVPRP